MLVRRWRGPNFLLAFAGLLGRCLLDSGCDELDALGSFLLRVPVGDQPINESRGFDSGHAVFLHWLINLLPGCDPRPVGAGVVPDLLIGNSVPMLIL